MLVPTIVVMGSPTVARAAEVHSWPVCPPFCRRSSACSAGDTVAEGPVCSRAGPAAVSAAWPSQPALGGVCCHAPVVPGGDLTRLYLCLAK